MYKQMSNIPNRISLERPYEFKNSIVYVTV